MDRTLVDDSATLPDMDLPENLRTLGPTFHAALEYAQVVHAAQVRKDTDIPYVRHVLAVAELVVDDGGDEIEAIAALLHDAAEDQGGRLRLNDIEHRFNTRVAEIVEGCSEWIEEPDQGSADKPSWCDRKREYINRIANEADHSILRVSLADKVNNSTTTVADLEKSGTDMLTRFNAGAIDQLWYYRGLESAFRGRGSKALHQKLLTAV